MIRFLSACLGFLTFLTLAACEPEPESTATRANTQEALGAGGPRLALVIGNSRYTGLPNLDNPEADARLMAKTLKDLGFQLQGGGPKINLTSRQMKREIAAYRQFIERTGGLGAIYFAGHAVQIDGENWLAPVDAAIANRADFTERFVSAQTIFGKDNAGGVNLVILDACRDNPFDALPGTRAAGLDFLRGAGSGLSAIVAPPDTLVAFATAPGSVALDGDGSNSPYAAALSRALLASDRRLEDAFIQVRRQVSAVSGGSQVPWETSSLTRQVALKQSTPPRMNPLPPGTDKASILASQRREIVYCKPLPNVEPQWRTAGLGCVSIRQLPDQSFEYAAYSGSRANPRCAYPRWSSKLDVFDARSQVFRYASSFYQFEGDTLVKTDERSGEKTVHYPTEICVVDEQCFAKDSNGRVSSHSNCRDEG